MARMRPPTRMYSLLRMGVCACSAEARLKAASSAGANSPPKSVTFLHLNVHSINLSNDRFAVDSNSLDTPGRCSVLHRAGVFPFVRFGSGSHEQRLPKRLFNTGPIGTLTFP